MLLSPQGQPFTQARAAALARRAATCALSAGATRASTSACAPSSTRSISIGDYVLSGGEIAALVVIDAVGRLVPGVLGCGESAQRRIVQRRPARVSAVHAAAGVPRRRAFPRCLLSGDHARHRPLAAPGSPAPHCDGRPDLLERAPTLSDDDRAFLATLGVRPRDADPPNRLILQPLDRSIANG